MGDTYPLTVIGKGDGFALFNLLTGEEGPVRPTYDGARFWRELETEPCPEACPRTARSAACSTCTWWTSDRVDHLARPIEKPAIGLSFGEAVSSDEFQAAQRGA
jgi:hypothetical protein